MYKNCERLVKQMRIAICDDQAECLEQTLSAIRKCISVAEARIDLFKGGLSFLKEVKRAPYDLVFLDIEMPEMDGITLAKKLRKLSADVPIIFLTSHIEYALDGYEVNALRYLTKPVKLEKIRDVISLVVDRMRQQRILWIKTDLGEQKLLVNDILFMEAQNQNVVIYTTQDAYCVRYNLSNYEKELVQDGFFRCHRGYLVSLSHIKNIGKNEITLTNGTNLPLSRTKEKELKEALFKHIRKEAF
jgi:DNA-binding LytR/AlgR family response regulator